jgi:hypothetical protein
LLPGEQAANRDEDRQSDYDPEIAHANLLLPTVSFLAETILLDTPEHALFPPDRLSL